MNDNGNDKPTDTDKPVNIDPRCIQEALRMYFQPVKDEDPHLDFYTMYKRESTEYDTEYMKKYNEDLNTTLIFAGLFSAVNSAFVIAVQSKLEPDSSERSEAYLRAILLSLDRSIAPGEHPTAPLAWGGPPAEIVATSDLLYASLLMSLLAAFVAMLGKQWLNRYLRHTGGSMIERCGDRQRKFDGLEKWPFHLFIETLSIMLQIALLLLLTCGLSRYMWSINTSVARVIIAPTVFGVIFYIGIVVAGTSSYECPFQTPASTALRALRDHRAARKLLGRLLSAALRTLQGNAIPQGSPASPPAPRVVSFIRPIWRLIRRRLISVHCRVRDTVRNPPRLGMLLSNIGSGVRGMGRKVGHLVIILLLHADRTLGNAKQRGIPRHNRPLHPAITTDDSKHQSLTRQKSGLLVPPGNFGNLRKQNANNARCVCWILRNITDPEAIDSALRLVSTVRWFEGDVDADPPYDIILSSFQECFDPNNVLYPGTRDRAFISGKALVQIHVCAAFRSDRSKYPIPEFPWGCSPRGVLHFMREVNFIAGKEMSETPANILWMSALLVTVVRLPPNPRDRYVQEGIDYRSHGRLGTSRAMDGNLLLAWCVILGGTVEEETFWADDKSYVIFTLLFDLFRTLPVSDLMGATLPFLSRAITDAIPVPDLWNPLYELLGQLKEWKEKPRCLVVMAYRWSLTISERIRKVDRVPSDLTAYEMAHQFKPLVGRPGVWNGWSKRKYILECYRLLLALSLEVVFRHGLGSSSMRVPEVISSPANKECHLLMVRIMLGAASVSPRSRDVPGEQALCAGLEDALYLWTLGGHLPPLGSCAGYLGTIVKKHQISPKLRLLLIRAVESMEYGDFERAGLETIIDVLDYLGVGSDDIRSGSRWPLVLKPLIRSQPGRKRLPLRYWRLLEELVVEDAEPHTELCHWDVRVMGVLENSREWEKLEAWVHIVWVSRLEDGFSPIPAMEDIKRVMLSLFQHRPSALSRFASLKTPSNRPRLCLLESHKTELQQICDQATHLASPRSTSPSSPVSHISSLPPARSPIAWDDTF